MRRGDWLGLLIVFAAIAGLVAFRRAYVEPRIWGDFCAAADPPIMCLPRAWLLWLQHRQLWGLAGLACGLWAFFRRSFAAAVAAVGFGIAGVVNYNATWGMLGASLGVWAWIRRPRPSAVTRPGPRP
jgi:hypothetical protein